MMVLMDAAATPQQIEEVVSCITSYKMQALRLPGDEHIAIGVASAIPSNVREPLTNHSPRFPAWTTSYRSVALIN